MAPARRGHFIFAPLQPKRTGQTALCGLARVVVSPVKARMSAEV